MSHDSDLVKNRSVFQCEPHRCVLLQLTNVATACYDLGMLAGCQRKIDSVAISFLDVACSDNPASYLGLVLNNSTLSSRSETRLETCRD